MRLAHTAVLHCLLIMQALAAGKIYAVDFAYPDDVELVDVSRGSCATGRCGAGVRNKRRRHLNVDGENGVRARRTVVVGGRSLASEHSTPVEDAL